MWDAASVWGGDLAISAGGDVALTNGAPLSEQRVLRRLLTNSAAYLWHLDYGAGLGAYVGTTATINTIGGVVRAQMRLEQSVSQATPPTVATQGLSPGCIGVSISYLLAPDNTTQVLSFSVGG